LQVKSAHGFFSRPEEILMDFAVIEGLPTGA
jgi:hypothetical protein